MAPSRRGGFSVHAAVPTLLVAALASVSYGGDAEHKRRKPSKSNGWRLSRHSFDRTLSFDDALGDWLLSAGSIALRDRVQVMPPVPDRYGVFWNKQSVDTNNFEVTFTISATDNGEGQHGPRDGALVFWLSYDDFVSSYDEQSIIKAANKEWSKGLAAVGLTLLNNKPNFKGLAMVFEDKGKQKVAGFWNDGSTPRSVADLTTATGAQMKHIDWMSAGTQVKVRVTPNGDVTGRVMVLDVHKHLAGAMWGWAPDGIKTKHMLTFQSDGQVLVDNGQPQGNWHVMPGNKLSLSFNQEHLILRFEGSQRAIVEAPQTEARATLLYGGKDLGENVEDWHTVFKFSGVFPKKKTGFIGLTGHTGTTSYIEVDMHRMETLNFDTTTVGEHAGDVLGDDLKEWVETLEQEKRFVSQASQAEAVVRLTKLLSDHVNKCDQAGMRIKSDLLRMEERLDKLGGDMSSYLAAAQAYSFQDDSFDSQVVLDHITSVKTILSSGKSRHDAAFDSVNSAAQSLKAKGIAKLSEDGSRKMSAVQDQSRLVEEFAAAGSSQANTMVFVMVIAVAGLGFLFFNRMRYYEKKHYI